MDIKKKYAINHSKTDNQSFYLNIRLFNTYNTIIKKILKQDLSGENIDLGCGDGYFSKVCASKGIKSYSYDYPKFDIEKDILPHRDNSIDFVTMNAVIEHISNPSHILSEINRVLKAGGLIFVRTPNWRLDYKNFYNDPTHVKPYTPDTLKNIFNLFEFNILFLEPGLICKDWFWWRLPNIIKWYIVSKIRGGTKSILCVATKINDIAKDDRTI